MRANAPSPELWHIEDRSEGPLIKALISHGPIMASDNTGIKIWRRHRAGGGRNRVWNQLAVKMERESLIVHGGTGNHSFCSSSHVRISSFFSEKPIASGLWRRQGRYELSCFMEESIIFQLLREKSNIREGQLWNIIYVMVAYWRAWLPHTIRTKEG